MRSEFGKGFVYCIGLFLMHAERKQFNFEDNYSMWFNAAADHLFELQIPKNLSNEFRTKIEIWQNNAIRLRLDPATKKDFEKSLETAKEILREYDSINLIEVEKGEFE